ARDLDHERTVRGQASSYGELPADVIADVPGGARVEKELVFEPRNAFRRVKTLGQLAEKAAQGDAQVVGASQSLTAPEGDHRRRTFGRRDHHAVGLDLVHAPGVGAEQESIPRAAFVDKPLIEFADGDAGVGVGRVLPRVGNDAAVDDGHLPTAGQGDQPVVNAVPTDPRLQGGQAQAGRTGYAAVEPV